VLASAVQCQNLSDAPGFSNTCEFAAPFQPEFSYRPTETDEVFFKLASLQATALMVIHRSSFHPGRKTWKTM